MVSGSHRGHTGAPGASRTAHQLCAPVRRPRPDLHAVVEPRAVVPARGGIPGVGMTAQEVRRELGLDPDAAGLIKRHAVAPAEVQIAPKHLQLLRTDVLDASLLGRAHDYTLPAVWAGARFTSSALPFYSRLPEAPLPVHPVRRQGSVLCLQACPLAPVARALAAAAQRVAAGDPVSFPGRRPRLCRREPGGEPDILGRVFDPGLLGQLFGPPEPRPEAHRRPNRAGRIRSSMSSSCKSASTFSGRPARSAVSSRARRMEQP